MQQATIIEAIDDAATWMNIPGVEGVGQGLKDGTECLVVFVSHKSPEISHAIPATFKGFPVILETSGIILAQS